MLTHVGTNGMFVATIWIAPAINFAVVSASNLGTYDGFALCRSATSELVKKYVLKA